MKKVKEKNSIVVKKYDIRILEYVRTMKNKNKKNMVQEVLKIYEKWDNNIKEIAKRQEISTEKLKKQWYILYTLEKRRKRDFSSELLDLYDFMEKSLIKISRKYCKSDKSTYELFEQLDRQFASVVREYEDIERRKEKIDKEDDVIGRLNHDCIEKEVRNFGHMGMVIEKKTFKLCRFSMLRLKDCVVSNCVVSQCIIDENSYLRHAQFINVDFTGTIFRDCNLEKAKFINCKMDYVKFDNCLIDIDNIDENSMPKQTNLKLAFYKSLYNNELQQGRTDTADKMLVKVIKEEAKFNRCVLFGKSEYYKSIRKGNVGKYINRCIKSILQSIFFGNGFSIVRSILSMFFILILFAIAYGMVAFNNCINMGDKIMYSVLLSGKSLLLGTLDIRFPIISESLLLSILILGENAFGILYFAFFTSIFYRKVTRR